jgi:DNA repair photolyase
LRKTKEAFMGAHPRKDIVEMVKTQPERDKITDRRIMLCFTCDPYPISTDTGVTREIIRAIKASGNHVQILTKGSRDAVYDFDLLDKSDSFGVSITGASKSVEPYANKAAVLLNMLIIAHERAIKTWCETACKNDPVRNEIGIENRPTQADMRNFPPVKINWRG